MIARKEAKRRFFALLACCIPLVLMLSMTSATMAYPIDIVKEGNDDVSIQLGNDKIWAGREAVFTEITCENDLLAAGQYITASNSTIKGSVRAVGQFVKVDNCTVNQNITIAGESVSVEKGSSNFVALMGAQTSFSGECNALAISGDTMYINGTIHGDVMVAGNKIEIGPDAVIEGTLKGETGAEPEIAPGAEVAAQNIEIDPENSHNTSFLDEFKPIYAAGLAVGAIVVILLSLGVFILVALLCEALARKQTEQASVMIKHNAAPLIISGLVGMLAAIPAVILLCIPIVTLPIAGVLGLTFAAIGLIGANFMAASLARLVFPHMGRMKRVALFALILGVVGLVPFVGGLVGLAGFVYLLGYIIQCIWLGMKESKNSGRPTPPPVDPQDDASKTPDASPVVTSAPVPPVSPVPPIPPAAPTQTQGSGKSSRKSEPRD